MTSVSSWLTAKESIQISLGTQGSFLEEYKYIARNPGQDISTASGRTNAQEAGNSEVMFICFHCLREAKCFLVSLSLCTCASSVPLAVSASEYSWLPS